MIFAFTAEKKEGDLGFVASDSTGAGFARGDEEQRWQGAVCGLGMLQDCLAPPDIP